MTNQTKGFFSRITVVSRVNFVICYFFFALQVLPFLRSSLGQGGGRPAAGTTRPLCGTQED